MGFGLFLMDSDVCNINRLDQKKKIRLDRIDRIFKVKHCAGLYGTGSQQKMAQLVKHSRATRNGYSAESGLLLLLNSCSIIFFSEFGGSPSFRGYADRAVQLHQEVEALRPQQVSARRQASRLSLEILLFVKFVVFFRHICTPNRGPSINDITLISRFFLTPPPSLSQLVRYICHIFIAILHLQTVLKFSLLVHRYFRF